MSLWTASAVVMVSWLMSGLIVQAVWAGFFARSALTSPDTRDHVLAVTGGMDLVSVALTAAIVKAGVAASSPFEISYARAVAAGLLGEAVTVLPLILLRGHPSQPDPIAVTIFGPQLLIVVAFLAQAWFVAAMAERRERAR